MARERSRGWGRRRRISPCAQTLVQTAWRSSARAAGWMRSREVFHRRGQRISCTRGCAASRGEEAGSSTGPEAIGGGGSRGVESPRSPRGRSARQIHSVEVVEDTGASISPKMATVMVAGGGRDGRATAGAIWIARELGGWEGRRRERGVGLGRLTQTRTGWLSPARWAGWAGRSAWPTGQWARKLTGQVGCRNLFYQLDLIQILLFKFKYQFFSEFKLNSNLWILLNITSSNSLMK
jgi:hypothetical protein